MDGDLRRLQDALPVEEWDRRVDEAAQHREVLDRVLARVDAGASKRAAIRAEVPDEPETTWVARLKRYERGGAEALIDHRVPPDPDGHRKLTPELVAMVRGLVRGFGRPMYSPDVQRELEALTGVSYSEATVRRAMAQAGVAQPTGRPTDRIELEAHPLAGAELLLACDLESGAVQHLAEAVHKAVRALPAPEGEVADEREHRDDLGRFTAAYNRAHAASRTEAELGARFDSVELKRAHKDLRKMRVAQASVETLERKLRALMALPMVTDSPRWAALRHWQGEHLGALVDIAYQPDTLDKFLREAKYAGLAHVLMDAAADFWLEATDLVDGPLEGMAVLYVDTAVKPVWTHHFTRCAKVTNRGRVMPAISTMFLHAGPGTPILFRSFSGTTSLPKQACSLLAAYEDLAGDGTVERMVVMDREGCVVGLMKELAERGWDFVIPLKSSVTGPNARFEEVGEWSGFPGTEDELCSGYLWLNDSKDRANPLRVRVVARRRHRTGKVAWYATQASPEVLSDADVLNAYFDRWPLQEHRFRDGNGRVHLDAHHGCGKRKVDNVSVIGRRDTLKAQLARLDEALDRLRPELAEAEEWRDILQQAIDDTRPKIEQDRAAFAAAMGDHADDLAERHAELELWQRWLERRRDELQDVSDRIAKLRHQVTTFEARRAAKQVERDNLATQQRIFTVDVELDQLMTALRLTFMNLCGLLMSRYLPGPTLQLDTLIRGVLTLPGERARTSTTETIRLYRHDRDAGLMERVDEACQRLTARELRREGRTLRFELVEPPALGPRTLRDTVTPDASA